METDPAGHKHRRLAEDDLTELRQTNRMMLSLVDELRQQNAALVEALKAVEWIRLEWGGNIECPWCGHGKIRGHHIDCKRQKALAEANKTD